MHRRTVVLPQPDGPRRPNSRPSSTAKETSSTATTRPWRSAKVLTRPSTSSTAHLASEVARDQHRGGDEDQRRGRDDDAQRPDRTEVAVLVLLPDANGDHL